MPQIDYLPVATSGGANVDSQGNFAGSGYQLNGFQNGIAQPYQANKIWRQASMIGNAIATFISNVLGINVLDDGNSAALITNLTNAIAAASSGAQNRIVNVAYSATPVFDASQGNTFEITLTGPVTSSTLVNIVPGQNIKFIVKQDGTGGHAFAPPAGVPMSAISTTASITNSQNFFVDLGSNVYQDTPLVTQ